MSLVTYDDVQLGSHIQLGGVFSKHLHEESKVRGKAVSCKGHDVGFEVMGRNIPDSSRV